MIRVISLGLRFAHDFLNMSADLKSIRLNLDDILRGFHILIEIKSYIVQSISSLNKHYKH